MIALKSLFNVFFLILFPLHSNLRSMNDWKKITFRRLMLLDTKKNETQFMSFEIQWIYI